MLIFLNIGKYEYKSQNTSFSSPFFLYSFCAEYGMDLWQKGHRSWKLCDFCESKAQKRRWGDLERREEIRGDKQAGKLLPFGYNLIWGELLFYLSLSLFLLFVMREGSGSEINERLALTAYLLSFLALIIMIRQEFLLCQKRLQKEGVGLCRWLSPVPGFGLFLIKNWILVLWKFGVIKMVMVLTSSWIQTAVLLWFLLLWNINLLAYTIAGYIHILFF